MTDSEEEMFPQNQEAAKRFKGGQKRKQPGTYATNISTAATTSSPPLSHSQYPIHPITGNRDTTDLVYQQPISLQHQPLSSQYPIPDQISYGLSAPVAQSNGNAGAYPAPGNGITSSGIDHRYVSAYFDSSVGMINTGAGQIYSSEPTPKTPAVLASTEPGVDSGPIAAPETTTAEEMDKLATMLSQTTLSSITYHGPSAAAIASDFDDEDLWGPQIRSTDNAEDLVLPTKLQILPEIDTRNHLVKLYYSNHYFLLPMVQREVLRVCEQNIHIPHCLLLCNAVYYCGSMFSVNTVPLRKDQEDESTVGEDFFLRGQGLLEKTYLTQHICTIQALLLFAIGHKSPAQRSGFISQAITMALDMGLHTWLDDKEDRFVRAYRARVFWCCYFFDSSASAIGGKPPLINDDEISVEMIKPGDLGPETEQFSDQYLIHITRGWQICRQIRKNSKLVSQRPPQSKEALLMNLKRLDTELEEWQKHLPKAFDLVPTKGCITSEIKALAAIAQLLCYALIILLHHPYLPNPKSPEAFQPPQGDVPDSQGYCTQAAKEITKISGLLLKEAPRTFEQSTPSRYSLNFAIRIHLRNAKCTTDMKLARDSRRDLQKSMDYVEQVENLQFYRIQRAKKSDVADLLASCRAALAQQKSSLDLAKEAAAAKRRQLLQAKLLAKEHRQQQLQQQQNHQQVLQQQQQVYQHQHPIVQSQQPTQQQQQPSPQMQQQLLFQQHQQQQQQQRLQLLAHAQQMKQNFLQQQQQQLQMLRQQHHQQQLQQQQQNLQQQQRLQQEQDQPTQQYACQPSPRSQPQSASPHPSPENSVLFHGQPPFIDPSALSSTSFGQFASLLNENVPDHQQSLSQQQISTSWIASNQPSVSGSGDYLQGLDDMPTVDGMIDFQSIAFDVQQEALFSSAATNSFINNMNTSSAMGSHGHEIVQGAVPELSDDVFLTSIPRSQTSIPSPTTSMSSVSVHNQFSPQMRDDSSLSPRSPPMDPSNVVSPRLLSSKIQNQLLQHQQQQKQQSNNSSNNTTNVISYNRDDSEPPMSASVASSPGSSVLLSEESLLQSFTGQMIHDTYYMHVDLPAEHPRNDPTSFVYLPSELEYGDTAVYSPSGGESTNSSEMGNTSPPPL
ncbi:hypothetical protein BG011_007046 [Mortierella polycephala]|uniref:Xylanolytic transcriptional activator regulatory domain-containing protein n=1 Tax=Mortierella polycephala TaxID=41804 RepID=A0A9P6PR57_9FUNG|nr:hypothetical protein BG011_007046 [Mortierella polycephala]